MIAAITPQEAKLKRFEAFPDFVLGGFNITIMHNLHNGKSTFTQNEVIDNILTNAPSNITRQTIFHNNWLNVEEYYEAAGWKVRYDKPDYTETSLARFTFTG
jgi:hypothetical protein